MAVNFGKKIVHDTRYTNQLYLILPQSWKQNKTKQTNNKTKTFLSLIYICDKVGC